jgi:cobalt-zinc-cadmium efflux system membrane fusion protein
MNRSSLALLATMGAWCFSMSLAGAADADDPKGEPVPKSVATSHGIDTAPKLTGAEGKTASTADHDHDAPSAGGDKDGDADAGKGKPIRVPAASLAALGITIESVARHALVEPIHAAATIVTDPDAQAVVCAAAPGILTAVHIQPGDAVQKGQALAEVASPEFIRIQNDYILKMASMPGAEAALQAAHQSVDRARHLSEGGVSQAELQRRESDLHQAEAALAMLAAERSAAAATLRLYGIEPAALPGLVTQGAEPTYALKAPLAGVVTDRDAMVGAQVGTDGRALFAIADPAKLWVIAEVAESQMAAAGLGSEAVVTTMAGERVGDGDIVFVYPAIDARTRTGRVRISLAKPSGLRSGQFVQVAITSVDAEAGTQVIAVPEEAVVSIEDRHLVFVAAEKDGMWSFTPHPVLVGPAVGGSVPIAQGLDTDDRVVVHGAALLKAEAVKSSGDND